jgi:lipopolysaccharide/colanic/teichoic acid biosynthesis glycosyltransferase
VAERHIRVHRAARDHPRPNAATDDGTPMQDRGSTAEPDHRLAAYERAKRTLDVVAAAGLLTALAPLLIAVGLAIRMTSPGPALFRQERVGRGGAAFRIYKFRTMRSDADDEVHRAYVTSLLTDADPADGGRAGVYKLTADPRITPLGAWLRRTSIDELPQLLNVLRGDMSLVGPRPALQYEVELYAPEQRARLEVLPGMTGLWQVEGRSDLPMREAIALDLQYVRTCSLRLDLRILLRTIPTVFRGL